MSMIYFNCFFRSFLSVAPRSEPLEENVERCGKYRTSPALLLSSYLFRSIDQKADQILRAACVMRVLRLGLLPPIGSNEATAAAYLRRF